MVRYVGNFVANGHFTVFDNNYYDDRTPPPTKEEIAAAKLKQKEKWKRHRDKLGTTELTRRNAKARKKRLARLEQTGIQKPKLEE